MPVSLSPQTIAIVKATVPALAEHSTAITGAMYRRLFEMRRAPRRSARPTSRTALRFTRSRLPCSPMRATSRTLRLWPGPNEDHYRITVERQVDGGASAFLHGHAVPGTLIECTPFADAGVTAGRIHYKLFGQTDEAMAA